MKDVDFDSFNEIIEKRRKEANKVILRNKTARTYRRRYRTEEERKILDLLAKKKWDEAVRVGKVKYLSERVIYYEFD